MKSFFNSSSLLALYFALAPLLVSFFAGIWIIKNESQIQNLITTQPLLCCIVCVFTCILALSPPTLLASIWGYFLGWSAIIPLIVINFFGILGIYFLAKSSNSKYLLSFIESNPKAKALLSKLHTKEIQFVFFTKLSPVLPFALTNFIFTSAGLQLKNIILGGLIGMLPRTLLAIWVGLQVKEFRKIIDSPSGDITTNLLIFTLVIVSILGLFGLIKKQVE